MTNPYIGQLSPTVGNGLGGLPRRGVAAVTTRPRYYYRVNNNNRSALKLGVLCLFDEIELGISTLSGYFTETSGINMAIGSLSHYRGFNWRTTAYNGQGQIALTRDNNYLYFGTVISGNGDAYLHAFDFSREKHRRYRYDSDHTATIKFDICAVVAPSKDFTYVGGSGGSAAAFALLTKVNMSTDAIIWSNRMVSVYGGILGIGMTTDSRLFALCRLQGGSETLEVVEFSTSTGDRIASVNLANQATAGQADQQQFCVTSDFIATAVYSAVTTLDIIVQNLALNIKKRFTVTAGNGQFPLMTHANDRCFVMAVNGTTSKLYEVSLNGIYLLATLTVGSVGNDHTGLDYHSGRNELIINAAGLEMHFNPDSMPPTFTANGLTWTDNARALQSWSAETTPTPVTTTLSPDATLTGYTFTVTDMVTANLIDEVLTEVTL